MPTLIMFRAVLYFQNCMCMYMRVHTCTASARVPCARFIAPASRTPGRRLAAGRAGLSTAVYASISHLRQAADAHGTGAPSTARPTPSTVVSASIFALCTHFIWISAYVCRPSYMYVGLVIRMLECYSIVFLLFLIN